MEATNKHTYEENLATLLQSEIYLYGFKVIYATTE